MSKKLVITQKCPAWSLMNECDKETTCRACDEWYTHRTGSYWVDYFYLLRDGTTNSRTITLFYNSLPFYSQPTEPTGILLLERKKITSVKTDHAISNLLLLFIVGCALMITKYRHTHTQQTQDLILYNRRFVSTELCLACSDGAVPSVSSHSLHTLSFANNSPCCFCISTVHLLYLLFFCILYWWLKSEQWWNGLGYPKWKKVWKSSGEKNPWKVQSRSCSKTPIIWLNETLRESMKTWENAISSLW